MRKYRRRFKAWASNRSFIVAVLAVFFIAFIFIMNQDRRLSVNPASYKPLLGLIADAESRGNYNAYFGNANNSSVDFTKMSIAEVMKWQQDYVASGSPSSAIGRYQIIDSTLSSLVQELDIDITQQFDANTQDEMAVALLERRGSLSYVNKEISRQEFAASLAQEWASLPKTTGKNPERSYYAEDGLNKALVNTEQVFRAIDSIKPES